MKNKNPRIKFVISFLLTIVFQQTDNNKILDDSLCFENHNL